MVTDDVVVVHRGRWAFEIAEVESKLTPHPHGESTNAHPTTVIALNRQPDGSWKVGRVPGLVIHRCRVRNRLLQPGRLVSWISPRSASCSGFFRSLLKAIGFHDRS
jgi:hypothetical protein